MNDKEFRTVSASEFAELRELVIRLDERVKTMASSMTRHREEHSKWLYFFALQTVAVIITVWLKK